MANSKPTTINTQWPQNGEKKSQPKENPTINYTQKKKNFPIINTTTNHTNPPPSQPKFQTTTTNTENLNTPTKNLQIDDPKLPTQTHKHRKPKSKPRNPYIEDQNHENEEWVSVSGYIFMCGWTWWVDLKKKERRSREKAKKKKKPSTKRKSNHQLQAQKEKIFNHQNHQQPLKPTSITA